MDSFLEHVRIYAATAGVLPSTVVRWAGCGGGTTWARWEAGLSSPTLRTADRILKYMADNPPSAADETVQVAE
ncbi:XRE family transcriptional regulator [Pseudooceanicola sp. HF7]|uniref:XRE family transcriptional regulator n=1 Tax=Pseudooceanicola sp. HF7 TaxID=2721560 RepID=UPI0014304923|nr:XRE family transcriptional regulator [Pseudooceanicola sp. HF7]NIZ09289.1 XRE family transcriptional regulator [Pseudooceanicola sp. HF7]